MASSTCYCILVLNVLFSFIYFRIRDRFLTLITVNSGKVDIYRAIVDFCNKNDIPYLKNLIGCQCNGWGTRVGNGKVKNRQSKYFFNEMYLSQFCVVFI